MTTQEFIDTLRSVAGRFAWSLEPDAGVHAHKRATPRLLVRGRPVSGPHQSHTFEPMGALLYARAARVLGPRDWVDAGDSLGLLPARAADLHAAGNDMTWAGEEGRREPIEYLQTLRERLLDAVGLGGETSPTPSCHESARS
jgi:hypothetical protein